MARITFDTNLTDSLLKPIIDKFRKDKKITYKEGWLVIHNFIKNQSLNPKVIAGIKANLANAPVFAKNLVKIDRLYIDYDSLSHSNSNSNFNLNSNSNAVSELKKANKLLSDKMELPNPKY